MSHGESHEDIAAQITERVRELRAFEAGDLVTVQPQQDDIPYTGKAFEGLPLEVDEAFHTDDDILKVDSVDSDDFEKSRAIGEYYVGTIRYTFQSDYTTVPLPESRLISWDKYDGPVHLRPHGDRYCYIEEGDECPICRRPAVLVEGKKDSHDHSQTRTCAVCGYDKGTEPS